MGKNAKKTDFKDSIIPLLEDLLQFSLSLTGNERKAARLMSEAMTEASQTWDEPDPKENCLVWLKKIIARRFISGIQNSLPNLSLPGEKMEESFYGMNTIGDSEVNEDISHFQDIYSFPAICRPGMILSFLEGRSPEQNAEPNDAQSQAIALNPNLGRRFIREELYAYLMGKDEPDLFAERTRGQK